MMTIGQSVPRIDAEAKVKGEARYPGDLNLENQVYMKILFSGRPHAIIRRMDVGAARAFPGVIAVLTAEDVPVNEYGLIVKDQPVLCGLNSSKPYADRVRFAADHVALVIAETEGIAEEACRLIAVDYEDLPLLTDPREAMRPDKPLLHPDHGSNIFTKYRIRKGDVKSALENAPVIIEGTYQTPAQEHAYLQPEAGVSYVDENGIVTVIVGGQWTHEDREQVAHALGLPEERVRIIYPAIGGAFGGREDMSVQIVLGLAAMKLHQQGINRPVKIIWSREESIIGHHKRHPYTIRAKWGATRQGKVIAAEVEVISDCGAYAYTSSKVLGNATLMCTGPYDIPNVHVDAYTVYTNNIPNGAFRGFGGPQGAFAAESQMNKLASVLGMDPVEIRMRNLLDEGGLLSVGTPLPAGVSIKQVVAVCAEKAGWTHDLQGWHRPMEYSSLNPDAPWLKKGIGFACAFKNVGFSFGAPENCWAIVELHGGMEIEKAVLFHAGAEVGQGSHTVFAQMTAEALGLPLDKVEVVAADTQTSLNSGSVSASRMTFMAGNAILGAAQAALEKWKNEERPARAEYQYRPPRTTPLDPETGKSEPNFSYGYVAEAVEIEVDTETGQIRLGEVICADDVGKAVNPMQVKGQVEGAVVQAAGYAVLENFIQTDGLVQTRALSTYLIPTVLDVPERVESVILEYSDPIGPWGARGMGEMPYLPFVPAVSAALQHATGKWFDQFPFTPERVLLGLDEGQVEPGFG
jgi:CO/xanthine dehydrogenase Mo-binding subunit